MSRQDLPIAIYYEQPNWFKPLFAELDRRGTNYVKLNAVEHSYGPADKPEEKYALVLNKMSPSAWNRGHGDQIFYTMGFLEHLEHRGVRVVNGAKAFQSELSKATQLSMLEGLGLGYPKARVIHRASQASEAAEGLRFPVVVKPNIGGSGSRGGEVFDEGASGGGFGGGGRDYAGDGFDWAGAGVCSGAGVVHRSRGSAGWEVSVRD